MTASASPAVIEIAKLAALFTKPGKHARVLSARMLATPEDVIGAVQESVAASGDLASLLESMGVTDASAALAAIPDLKAAQTKLQDALSQITDLLAGQATQDAAVANSDVAAAVAARNYPKDDQGITFALSATRQSKIDARIAALPAGSNYKVQATARAEGRRDFLAMYGVAPAQLEHLLSTIAAGPAGQTTLPSSGLRSVPLPARGQGMDPTQLSAGGNGKKIIDLTSVNGRNPVEKLHNWLRTNEPSMEKATFTTVDRRAHALRRDKNVEIITQAAAS